MEVTGSMDRDLLQPAAKSVPRVVLELGQLGHEDGQHLLNEIRRIGGRQPVLLAPMEDQGRVQLDEPCPSGLLVRLAEPAEQTDRCGIHEETARVEDTAMIQPAFR